MTPFVAMALMGEIMFAGEAKEGTLTNRRSPFLPYGLFRGENGSVNIVVPEYGN